MEIPTEIPEMINGIVVAWWQIHNRLEKSWNKLVIPLEFPVAPGLRKFYFHPEKNIQLVYSMDKPADFFFVEERSCNYTGGLLPAFSNRKPSQLLLQ